MKAFNNDVNFKNQLLEAAAKHKAADEYIKGTFGEAHGASFKGCSVGCSVTDVNKLKDVNINVNSHSGLAEALEIPEFICHLQDSIFEGLPEPLNAEWTGRLFNAIPVGVDLTPALPRFLLKNLDRLPETDRADVVASIKGVKEALQNWADTGEVDVEAARSAAESAESAAREQMANDLIECIEVCK